MKKLFLALAISATFPVFAQTAVDLPTPAVIPATVTESPNATAALNNATTNRVFIDQSGSNPDINISQQGSGNSAGISSRPLYLRGADQTLVTIQQGNNNSINLELVNPVAGTAVGATVTIQQYGDNNSLDASCGYGTNSDGSVDLVGCKAADLNWKFTGSANSLQFRGTGDDLKSAATLNGGANTIKIDALTSKQSQTLMISGDFNDVSIKQDSLGAAGSSTLIDQTGTGAKFVIQQSGTVDNVVNIKSVANGGTFTISQKN
jgi:hypothetical protein